jgi:hypothetical protein
VPCDPTPIKPTVILFAGDVSVVLPRIDAGIKYGAEMNPDVMPAVWVKNLRRDMLLLCFGFFIQL